MKIRIQILVVKDRYLQMK